MKKLSAFTLSLFLFLAATSLAQDTLTNKTIVDMTKAGMGKDIIIQTINESHCKFNTDVQTLINLKKIGLHDDVISAMKNRNKSPSATTRSISIEETKDDPIIAKIKELGWGVYYLLPDGSVNSLEPTVFSGIKEKGLANKLSGIFNATVLGTVNGSSANTQIANQRIKFYFNFDPEKKNQQNPWQTNPASPNEYVAFKFKTTKSGREIVMGKGNNVSSSLGIDEKNQVKFRFKKISEYVYECHFEANLDPGEYGIMHASMSPSNDAKQVYDFGISTASDTAKKAF